MSASTETNAIGESMEPAPPVFDRAAGMKTLSPLIFGHSAAMTLKTAVVLGIPDIIAKAGHEGTMSLQEIAAQLPSDSVDEQALSRFMRALVQYGIFSAKRGSEPTKESTQYGLTAASKMLVRENNAKSLADMVLFANLEASQKPWQQFHETILYGKSAWEATHGKNCWEYAADDLEFKELQTALGASVSEQMAESLIKGCPGFKDMQILVDGGGGNGNILARIVAAHPHLHGINLDLPGIVAQAPQFPGVEHVGGSVLESIPSGDAILMKNVMHLFDDKHCIQILHNCRQALPPNGKVLIVDPVLPPEGDYNSQRENSAQMDLLLLVHAGGVDRTEQEWRKLLNDGGFPKVQFLSLIPQCGLIEASQ